MKKILFAMALALPLIFTVALAERPVATQSPNELLIAKAKAKFGRNFLGAEAIKLTYHDSTIDENAYPFPLTETEIDALDTADNIIYLRVSKINGHDATIKYLASFAGPRSCGDGPCIGLAFPGYEDETFFKEEALPDGWVIVTKENVAGSYNQDYCDQTKKLEEHLGGSGIIPLAGDLRTKYVVAAEKFRSTEKPAIDLLLSPKKGTPQDSIVAQRKRASDKLAQTEINVSARELAVEVFYRRQMYLFMNNEHLFPDTYVWTRSMTADGRFVAIGASMENGIAMSAAHPNQKSKNGGVTCSRSAAAFQNP